MPYTDHPEIIRKEVENSAPTLAAHEGNQFLDDRIQKLGERKMKLIISFSGRSNGNCDQIASSLSMPEDRIVYFRALNIHSCANCGYECFDGACKYRDDDVYALYESMLGFDKVILVVPMYCGNPSSLYFVFNERCQDYFMHNDTYETIVQKLYIIGIYGKKETTPDFIPCLEKWFAGSPYANHVLGIERHTYEQKMCDNILDIEEVKMQIEAFVKD